MYQLLTSMLFLVKNQLPEFRLPCLRSLPFRPYEANALQLLNTFESHGRFLSLLEQLVLHSNCIRDMKNEVGSIKGKGGISDIDIMVQESTLHKKSNTDQHTIRRIPYYAPMACLCLLTQIPSDAFSGYFCGTLQSP